MVMYSLWRSAMRFLEHILIGLKEFLKGLRA
jgi:hypothetical protein